MISLNEHSAYIPESELRRIQKKLRAILRFPERRSTIVAHYRRAASPNVILNNDIDQRALMKLVSNGGQIESHALSAEEYASLKDNPYAVWLNETDCALTQESAEFLVKDGFLSGKELLLEYIIKLNRMEVLAWAAWLGFSEPVQSPFELYSRVLCERSKAGFSIDRADPAEHSPYLQDIFPDQPANCPVAWFYRGIIPLYESLKRAEFLFAQTPEQRTALAMLKCGFWTVKPEVTYGLAERHRIVHTRERTNATNLGVLAERALKEEGTLFS